VRGSTDEHNSIVVETSNGSKTLDSGSPQWHTVMLQWMDIPTQTLRRDATHFLPAGSVWVAKWLMPQICRGHQGPVVTKVSCR
jgi:hypothetical protein